MIQRSSNDNNSNGLGTFFCWVNKIKTLLGLLILLGSGLVYIVFCYADTNNRLTGMEEGLSIARGADDVLADNLLQVDKQVRAHSISIVALQRDVEHIRAVQDQMYRESKEAWKEIINRLPGGN